MRGNSSSVAIIGRINYKRCAGVNYSSRKRDSTFSGTLWQVKLVLSSKERVIFNSIVPFVGHFFLSIFYWVNFPSFNGNILFRFSRYYDSRFFSTCSPSSRLHDTKKSIMLNDRNVLLLFYANSCFIQEDLLD